MFELLLLFGAIICAAIAGALASSRNRSAVVWFFLGLFIGPLAWIVAAFPKLQDDAPVTIENATRNCPFCAEEIKMKAALCKHCGKDVPAASATNMPKSFKVIRRTAAR